MAGATGTKPSQLAPKEIGDCRAPRWSGLWLVGRHSRTEHGQFADVARLTHEGVVETLRTARTLGSVVPRRSLLRRQVLGPSEALKDPEAPCRGILST
jgi:hypothetical protein